MILFSLLLCVLSISAERRPDRHDDLRLLSIIYADGRALQSYDQDSQLLQALHLKRDDHVYVLGSVDSLLTMRLGLQGRARKIVCVAANHEAYERIREDIRKLRRARRLAKGQTIQVVQETAEPIFMSADVVICEKRQMTDLLRHQLKELAKGARVATTVRMPHDHVFTGGRESQNGFYVYKVSHPIHKDAQHKSIEGTLHKIYETRSGFGIPAAETQEMKDRGAAPTYGEITYPSAQILFEDLGLNRHDVLYDLGSGVGRFVMHAHLATRARKTVGIELSETRHQKALAARDELKKMHKMHHVRSLTYIHDDMLKADWSDATVVYLCSTCFSDDLMRELMRKMEDCKEGLRVITLRQLPPSDRFELIRQYQLPMTWSSASPVYVYRMG